jgi:hypothetical protein
MYAVDFGNTLTLQIEIYLYRCCVITLLLFLIALKYDIEIGGVFFRNVLYMFPDLTVNLYILQTMMSMRS